VLTQELFDALDEMPTRRADGFIVGMKSGRLPQNVERSTAEFRSRVPHWKREADRRKRHLELLGYLIAIEEERN
jgi:hypothetical protein